MNKIKILPKNVYTKIAAGEVVERPASIVRELIDNAIDASATKITINVENGGIKKISIIDNGTGISKDDLPLALSKHATSKIENIDDLLKITTMGFRGEALSSIETISKIVISSSTDSTGEEPGYKISNFGENKNRVVSIAHRKGTKVEIEDIFYNIPARKKFLKSALSEWNSIKSVVVSKVFGNLNIAFKLYNNNAPVFSTEGDSDFAKAFFAINKKENAFSVYSHEKMVNKKLKITVFYSSPEVFFSNRRSQMLYVNKRPVSVNYFYVAVDSGVREYISPGRHPLVFMYIDIDPDMIDVNIHPAKKEIKFIDQSSIFLSIQSTLSEAMSKLLKRELYTLKNENIISEESNNHLQLELKDFGSVGSNSSNNYFNEVVLNNKTYELKNDLEKNVNANYEILGVAFDTYIVVQREEKIILIDQHAACERIIYNRKKELYSKNKSSEQLIIPIVTDIDNWDKENDDRINELNDNGFDIERGEGSTIIIREAPSILLNRKNYDESVEIIRNYIEETKKSSNENIIDAFLLEASCKEAVKKGDKLTLLEIAEIVDAYFKAGENNCPHGRPIHFELTKDYLEKIFQRKR